jgi:hypothetical protein
MKINTLDYARHKLRDPELLSRIMYLAFAVSVLAQLVVLIYFWGKPQHSDQKGYMELAKQCFGINDWYPIPAQVYSRYIWAPGFVNFLILQLKLFGTMNANGVFNLLMNLAIVGEIYFIGQRFFNVATAKIAVIFWCILYSNIILVAPSGTEIPFLFLCLTAFCLCLSRNLMLIILAGALFALANWIRPLAIIFMPTVILYMIIHRYKLVHYISLLVPIFVVITWIGSSAKERTGYFVHQSTTSGMNLIMTSNDKAYGGVANFLTNDPTSTAYIADEDKYTFVEKDSIWKSRAIVWIKSNPVKAAQLYAKKLVGLYVEDSWADRPLLGGDALIGSYVVTDKVSKASFFKEIGLRVIKSLFFYLLLVAFVYSVIVNRKELISEKGLFLLILVLGTLLTSIFAVSPRYHYPFTFVLVLFAAYGFDTLLRTTKKEISEHH